MVLAGIPPGRIQRYRRGGDIMKEHDYVWSDILSTQRLLIDWKGGGRGGGGGGGVLAT